MSMDLTSDSEPADIETSMNIKDVDQLKSSYMHLVLLKDIILGTHEDETQALKDFVAYCRDIGIDESQLEKFENEYQDRSPIYWYTYESFLYRMLNRSLALFEIEKLTKMGFFIRSLHRQLENLHKQESYDYSKPLIVYRGQGLSKEKFDRLSHTKGGLLSFNNFLSTSQTRDIAMKFVQRALDKHKEYIGVIFVITVHPNNLSKSTIPFASIESESAMPNEKEILFSMPTVFRVCKIEEVSVIDCLWEVHLTLTDDKDSEFAIVSDGIREKRCGSTLWKRLGDIMLNMGYYDLAEELYYKILNNTSNNNDRDHIYQQLKCLKKIKNQCIIGNTFDKNSLEIQPKTIRKNDQTLLVSHNVKLHSEAMKNFLISHNFILHISYDSIDFMYYSIDDLSVNSSSISFIFF